MKKILFFLTMLLAFCLPTALQAQTDHLTVHDGTTTNGYVPLYGFYADSYLKCEFVFPAEELSVISGGSISKMTFYASQSSVSWGSANFQVFLTEVDDASISAFAGPGTVVYEGALSITENVMVVEFSTPYEYQGGNLLVGVYCTATGSYVTSTWFGETVNGASVQGYSYSSLDAISPTQRNFLPKTTFEYTPGSGVICDKPETFVASDVTAHAATLTWTGGSGTYNVEVKGGSYADWTSVLSNTTLTTTTLTLAPATNYQARVQSVCSDGTSGWKTVSFLTACDVIPALGYTENFDSYTAGAGVLPLCWSRINTSTNSTYADYPRVYNSSGNRLYFYSVYSSYSSYDPQDQYAILPEMSGLGDKLVSLQARGYNANSTFKIGTMSDPTDASTFTEIATQNGLTTSYQQFEYIVPATSDNYLAIMIEAASSSRTYNGVYIDDITITEVPTCPKPSGLTSANVTARTVDLSWTENGDATAWIVAYKISSDENFTEVDVEGEPSTTLTNLTPDKQFVAKVRSNCGGGDLSDWANATVSFHTLISCPAPTDLTATNIPGSADINLSWTENGDATTWQICINGDMENLIATNRNENNRLSRLQVDTIYTAMVRAICGEGDTSAWSSTVSFEPTNSILLTVNEGTGTNNIVPVYGLWVDDYSRSQFIIPADTLADMAYGQISRITFYSSDANKSWGAARFKVYLSEVDATTISSLYDWDALDAEVYEGSLSIVGNKMVINFDAPYQYMGGNLLVGVNQVVSGSYSSCYWYGVTATGASMGGYGSSISQKNFLPKTTFKFMPGTPPNCIKPTGLTVQYEGGNTATVSCNSEYENFDIELNGTEITNVSNPYTLENLAYETSYSVRIRANCGGSDGVSDWTNPVSFTTDVACPAPTNVNVPVEGIFARTATINWEGNADQYEVLVGEVEVNNLINVDFESGIPTTFTNNSTNPWTVVDGNGSHVMQSGNAGVSSSTSEISATVNFPASGTIEFDAECRGEGTTTIWDKCIFKIDGVEQFTYGANVSGWNHYSYEVTPGDHTFVWSYTKDSSVNPTGDYFAVDNIVANVMGATDAQVYSDINDTTLTLEGLTPETLHLVQVRANCGDDLGNSVWTDAIAFTTTVACPAPTGITASDEIGPHSAELQWNGNADNYNIQYRIAESAAGASFFDNFENGLDNWTIYTEGEAVGSNPGWYIINPISGLELDAHSGSYVASAWSWNNNAYDADNWLVTPLVALQGTLKFWVRTNSGYPDEYEVLLSTQGNAITDFTTTLQAMAPAPVNGEWNEVSIDLSDYANQQGYIAIHHASYDMNYLLIDDFGLFGEEGPADEWTNVTSGENSVELTGLAAETTYEVQVQANCGGEDGVSAWSATYTFRTTEACPAPSIVNITPDRHSAELELNGSGESYAVQYRPVASSETLFYDDFEEGMSDWTIYTEGESLEGYDGWIWGNTGSNMVALSVSSYDETSYDADNWLVTPQVTLQGTLKFLVASNNSDEYEVLLSTRDNRTNSFTTTLQAMASVPTTNMWTEVSIDLSEYNGQQGYIAFHHVYEGGGQLLLDDISIVEEVPAGEWVTVTSDEETVELTGLAAETTYEARAKVICGGEDGESNWTPLVTFTTTLACPVPTDLEVTEYSAHTANLEWEGIGEGYNVRYREYLDPLFFGGESFENGMPAGWTSEGDGTWIVGTGDYSTTTGAHTGSYNAKITHMQSGYETYLVTPVMNLSEMDGLRLNLWYVNRSWTGDIDEFGVYYRIDGGEWNEIFVTEDSHETWTALDTLLPDEAYAANCQLGFKMTDNYGYGVAIDDIRLGDNEPQPENEWMTVTADDNSVELTGLDGETTYEVQVQADCGVEDRQSVWSGSVFFTTEPAIIPTLIEFEGETSVCDDNETEMLVITDLEEDQVAEILWSTGDEGETAFLPAGVHTVTVTSITGDALTESITVKQKLSVNTSVEMEICPSELPYTWNDVEFEDADTQDAYLEAANGCDSIVTMTLILKPTFEVTVIRTVCQNELPITWNGVVFEEAGSEFVTFTATSNGCDSTVTMILEVNPSYDVTDERTVCENELPITWNGVVFTEAGTKDTTLATVNGCDSIVTMTLTVNPSYSVTDVATICENDLPYTWNGVEFTEAGTKAATLPTVNNCDSVVTMTLNVNFNVTTYDTMTVCANELPYTWGYVTFAEAGTEEVILTAENECDSTSVLTLNVKESYAVTDTKTICENDLPYTWNGVEFTEAGTKDVTLTASNECDSVVTMVLNVNFNVTTDLTESICPNAIPYSWNGVVFDGAGTESVIYTAANGCDSIVNMTVVVKEISTATDTKTICASELPYTWNEVVFEEAGTQTVTLTAANECDSVLTMTLNVNPVYAVTDSKIVCPSALPYTWNGVVFEEAGTKTATLPTINGCDSVVTMTLIVNDSYEESDAKTICASELPITWNGVEFTEAGTQTATLQSANGCDSIVTMTLTVKATYAVTEEKAICASELPITWNEEVFDAAGTKTVTLTANNGCDSVVTMVLTVKPTYYFEETRTIFSGAMPYTWNGYTFTEAGEHTVTFTAQNGCDSTIAMTLIVSNNYQIAETRAVCDNELPYTWDSIIFNEAGTVVDTMQASIGSDSIVTKTLVVNPTYNVTDEKTICASELPYTWNGVEFTEAGEQIANLHTTKGCDSIVTMTLYVNPIFNVTDEKTICASELPITWNGVEFTEAGTKTVTLPTVEGCDSVVTMTLTVNPIYAVTDAKAVCLNELPITWNGVEFTEADTKVATLQTVNGCDSVVTMTLTVNPIYNVTDKLTICESELPITWNGVEFTEADTKTVTLQTVEGCDSVVTMTLTVNPIYSVTDAQTICASELPITWNGVEFTAAGTKATTLATINGCDSVVTMTLTVNPIYDVTDTKTICASELPITWNGVEFTEAGTKTTTLETVNGCDSVVTMTLTVNPVYTVTDAKTICASELPYTWNGVEFEAAGVKVAHLQTVNGCDSAVTMTLTVNPTYNVTDEQTICASELPIIWNGVTFTEAGVKTTVLETVEGCDSVVTMTLNVNPIYDVTDAMAICPSELPIIWNGVEFTEAGTQTTTLATVNGCDSVVTMTLTVYPIYDVTDTKTVCASELPIIWNGVEFTEAGTQTTTLETVNGCDSVVTMTLFVNPIFNVTDTKTICETALPYTWNGITFAEAGNKVAHLYTVNGCDSIVTMTLNVNPTVYSTVERTVCASELPYSWNGLYFTVAGTKTITLAAANGCDSVVTMTLNVNPVVNTTDTRTICESELPYTWNGVVFTAAGAQNVTLSTTNGCDSTVMMILNVNQTYAVSDARTICASELPYSWNGTTFTAAGTRNVTLQTVNGCDSVVTMTLTVNPVYNVTTAKTICTSELPYTWNGITFTAAGTRNVTLEATTGCDSIVTMVLTVNPVYTSTVTRSICPSELPYVWNGVVFTEAGTQTLRLDAANGCDSLITMTLTVKSIAYSNVTRTICESELPYTWNGIVFHAGVTQTVTLTAANGCDSVVTMTLNVNPVVTTFVEETACESFTWIDGVTYTSSTTAPFVTLTSSTGCDSIVFLHLTINHVAHTEFTVATTEGCYTWNGETYCNSGDYTQTFTAATGCDSVVTLHLTTSVGIEDHDVATVVYLAPNPAKSVCRIIGLETTPKLVEVYDMRGSKVMMSNDTELDVATLPTGMYIVKVITAEENVINLKLIKK